MGPPFHISSEGLDAEPTTLSNGEGGGGGGGGGGEVTAPIKNLNP